MAAAKKPARKPRRQYTEEEKAGFREKQQAELKEIAVSIEQGVADSGTRTVTRSFSRSWQRSPSIRTGTSC